ncbi:MAG: 4-oxalocrotonate tautomerase family protein [Synergistaceae bacterium]|jgi:phenylpyruvate tautomerase PptA (4-oxalocrotonate tautomerase family)|nr:4-oxalocrotonate tautomerase family protein [Synergistaceae bacterium]
MPTYHVYINQGKLSAQQKKNVAAAITEGHVALTGAPKYYVQVIIDEIPDENRFVCGIPFSEHMWIRGDVRCRTPEANKALMMELIERVSKVCDFDSSFIWCDLCSIEPTNIVKFGTVFPPAGEEKAWFGALPDEVKETIQNLLDGSI